MLEGIQLVKDVGEFLSRYPLLVYFLFAITRNSSHISYIWDPHRKFKGESLRWGRETRHKEFSGLFCAMKSCKGKPSTGAFEIDVGFLNKQGGAACGSFFIFVYLFLIVLSMLIHAERLAEVSQLWVGNSTFDQPSVPGSFCGNIL